MTGNVVRRRAIDGSETDVFSRARHWYAFTKRPGVTKWVKSKANRRERQEGKHEIADQRRDTPK